MRVPETVDAEGKSRVGARPGPGPRLPRDHDGQLLRILLYIRTRSVCPPLSSHREQHCWLRMKTPLNSAFGAGYLWLLALTSGCAFAAHHVSDQSTLPSLKYNSNQPGIGNGYDISDTGPRTLNTLSLNEFTTLRHEAYPKHSVRVKKSKFCDGTVE